MPSYKFAVAVDVETTGPRLGTGDAVVAFGAALIDVTECKTIETRRWTMDTTGITWDAACVERFWNKFPVQHKELIAPAPEHVAVEPDAAGVLLTPAAFSSSWKRWMTSVYARFPGVCLWSDFPMFDLAWLNHTLLLGGGTCSYLDGPGGAWQTTLDIDAYLEGLAPPGAVLEEAKKLYPDGDHFPERDAETMGLRFAYTLRACGR